MHRVIGNDDRDASPGLAQRTCTQCHKSKKRCDKLIPKCSRCLRLVIDCSYPDPERPNESDAANEAVEARFDEIFERLKAIEAQVFPSESMAQSHDAHSEQQQSLMDLAQSHGIENPNPTNWALEPGTLKPQYLSLMLWQSVFTTLDEHKTTLHDITRTYISRTNRWLPMISLFRYHKEFVLFNQLRSSDNFLLLVLAIHLLNSPRAEHPPCDSLAESPWYRKCKYMFSQFVAFREPGVELIQAGMLIAVFEFNHCVANRALTTLGICCRLAYLLDFDEIMAKHAAQDLGELNRDDEEVILTWMGLTRLERYFNMPPVVIPKSQFMSLHFDTDSRDRASPYSGPEISRFNTLDLSELADCIYEYDAAQRNGRVQKFIRKNRFAASSPELREKIKVMVQDLEDYLVVRKAQMERDGSWAGMHVVLGAAIQIQCFFAAKNTCVIDVQIMRSLHAYVDQLRVIISRCRNLNGFEDDYLNGVQPTWCSVPYQALWAYRMVEQADTERSLPSIDMTLFVEVLQTMSPNCQLAAKCLELLELPQTMEDLSASYYGQAA